MVYLILDNIRSVYNVGSIFRTADAAGVEKIYLCGTTPTPVDRFGRKRRDLAKVSLGAEESVSWEYFKNPLDAINLLKSDGVKIISVEQARGAKSYKDIKTKEKEKIAYVFGSETEGVSPEILKASDEILEIPMKGKKESLNVSVAAGIILF